MKLLPSILFMIGSALLLLPSLASTQESFEECTAGVASGRATVDGRPLLWKTRDAGATNNEVIWNTSGKHNFVSVINAGNPESSWMGVNEHGFSIINTLSTDLSAGEAGMHNGSFMVHALQECATVEEFEELEPAEGLEGAAAEASLRERMDLVEGRFLPLEAQAIGLMSLPEGAGGKRELALVDMVRLEGDHSGNLMPVDPTMIRTTRPLLTTPGRSSTPPEQRDSRREPSSRTGTSRRSSSRSAR